MPTNVLTMEAGRSRDHLLADAGLIFVTAAACQSLIRSITRLATEGLADCAHARLRAEDGSVPHEEYAQSSRVTPELARQLASQVEREHGHALDLVFELGGPILLPVKGLRSPDGEVLSAMAVAIASSERSLGTLTLISTTEPYGPEDLELAAELGRRTGQALEQESRYLQVAKWRQAWTEELATVVHDLRSPLSVVHLTAGMLKERLSGDEFAAPWLERIEAAVQRMDRMIADILESVRTETVGPRLDLRPTRACSVLREVMELNEPEAQKKLVVLNPEYPETTVYIRTDFEAIVRAISNLVSNAVKFSRPGGRIHLAIERRPASVVLRVADEGPGIPEEHLPFVFDRYWKAPDQPRAGVGLGLYIAKSFVEAHGGRIWVDSRPGCGSTFFVALPASSDPPGPPECCPMASPEANPPAQPSSP